MTSWGILRTTGIVVAATVGLVAFVATPASAADVHGMAKWVSGVTLEKLGVTEPSASLSAALDNSISEAFAAGLISPTVEDLAAVGVNDPDAVSDDEITKALDEGLVEQSETWEDAKAEWHATFDEVKAAFDVCREAAEGGANLCAHQFRYEMQVNHVTAWLARHTAKLGDISALPANKQEAARAKLERKGELAAARLERASAQLEKKTGKAVSDDLIDDVARAIEENASDTTSKPGKGNKPEKANEPSKGEKPEKPEKLEKPAKTDKSEKTAGSGNGKSNK